MTAPGSRAKRSSSSVKGRTSSRSIASTMLHSSSLIRSRAAMRSGVSGETAHPDRTSERLLGAGAFVLSLDASGVSGPEILASLAA
jgi:hypothetical protein